MLSRVALFIMLWLTSYSLSTPLIDRPSRKFLPRQSSSLDNHTASAVQAAARQKFRNASALLAGQGTSPGYTIPPSLQDTYDRASDYATNITLWSSQSNSSASSHCNSSSAVRVASTGALVCVNKAINTSLLDTEGVDDLEDYGVLRFGSQKQPLMMVLDTASAELYGPFWLQVNASTTLLETGEELLIRNGPSNVGGRFVQDLVTVGSLVVHNQTFGVVDQVSPSVAQSPTNGSVGLAFGSIASSHQPTLFENMMADLAAPLFSFYIPRTQPSSPDVCFGGIDQSKVNAGSDISWVQVVSKTYWTVNMTGVLVKSLTPTEVSAIIDTSTSYIYIPDEIVTMIYKQIPGSQPAPDYGDGFYAYPCDTQTTVSFVLGGTTLALDPRDMNIGQYTSDPSGRTCVGAIVAAGSIIDDGTIAILGQSLLKSYVSVFDHSHDARVGFVKSINE